ncbi:hypothetical protein [Bradyrhizobium centrolobii]|uniref:hypothetical protein n=1 Tax=Bradyrhizobium centrolobii TaxID=1505087 RepID=UPI000B2701C4
MVERGDQFVVGLRLGRRAGAILPAADDHHFVQMATSFGGGRIIDWLSGEQLPRIC